jgi:hypothetical protein
MTMRPAPDDPQHGLDEQAVASAPEPDMNQPPPSGSRWDRILTLAGLAVLGISPWAQAQLDPIEPPPAVICPPLTAIANPTIFDVFFGTTPIRFPFQ